MAKGTGFKKFNSENTELVRVQQNVEAAFSNLISSSLLDGILLESVSVAVGDNTITHKLGRKIRGYIPISPSAASTFYAKIYTTDTDLEHSFTLNSSAACTLALYVF